MNRQRIQLGTCVLLSALLVLSVAPPAGATHALPPTLTETSPASPNDVTTIAVNGVALPGDTVTIYGSVDCLGTPLASDIADDQGNFVVSGVPVADNTTVELWGNATSSLTGHTSICSPTSVTYTDDSAPPTSEITTAGATITENGRILSLAYTASDEVSSVSEVQLWVKTPADADYQPGPVGTDANGTFAYEFPPLNGVYSFYTIAKDALYEASATPEDHVEAAPESPDNITTLSDTFAPTITITGGPSGLTGNDSPTFSFLSTERNSTFECRLDSIEDTAWTPCNDANVNVAPSGPDPDGATRGSISYPALSAEDHTFDVRATDALGNTGDAESRAFTINVGIPEVRSITRLDPNPSNLAEVDFLVEFTEPVTGVDELDFSTLGSSTVGALVTAVSDPAPGSAFDDTYTVTVSSGTGDGIVDLDVLDTGIPTPIQDQQGNALGSGATDGEDYTIDKTAPEVSSIVREAGSENPTITDRVNYTVTFSEDVTGVDLGDLALATTGSLDGVAIDSVSDDVGSTRTVTVTTGTGDGSIRLDVPAGASIEDDAGNPLDGGFTGGQTFTIARTIPFVESVAPKDGSANPTNASTVDFTVTFSEDVTGVDAEDFSVAENGTTGAFILLLDGVDGSGSNYTVTVNTGTGSGTIGLNVLNDGSIRDSDGNPLAAPKTDGETFTIDKAAPIVEAIDRTGATSDPTNADIVYFLVEFSEAVNGVDPTDFAPSGTATGPSVLAVDEVFRSEYLVAVDTGSGSGTLGLDLIDDDSIQDDAGNKLGGEGTGPLPIGDGSFSGQTYTIDKTAPSVTSINRAAGFGNPTNAASVDFTVTFSEVVSGVDVDDLVLGLATSGASITSLSGTGNTRTVTVDTGADDADGELRLDVIDTPTIDDSVGNAMVGGFDTGQIFRIAKTIPTVEITRTGAELTNAPEVVFDVTFSEDVTGVDADDFSVADSTTTGAFIPLDGVAGAGSAWAVTVNTGTGDGLIDLDLIDDSSITDADGNGLADGDSDGETYTIDKTVPSVVSIDRTEGAANPTNTTGTLEYVVEFSEAVKGVTVDEFSLTTTGTLAGATIDSISADTGTTMTVTLGSGTGDGNVGLDLIDDDDVTDLAGNPLGGPNLDPLPIGDASFTTGQTYTLDRTVPLVSSIGPAAGTENPTSAQIVDFTVVFTEDVNGVDTTDFSVAASTMLGTAVESVSGSGDTYAVRVATGATPSGTTEGVVDLDLVDDGSIVDTASNELGGGFDSGTVFNIDRNFPTVVDITRTGTTPTVLETVDFTVGFSEAVSGVDAGDFSTIGSTTDTQEVLSVLEVSPTEYLVTVATGTLDGIVTLVLVDDDSIVDTESNSLGGPGTGNGDFSLGEHYNVERLPVDTALTLAPSDPTNDNTPEFAYSATDGDAIFHCRLQPLETAFTACDDERLAALGVTTAAKAYATELSDGRYRLDVYAEDHGGDDSATPATVTFSVDTVAPRSRVLVPDFSTGPEIEVAYTDANDNPGGTGLERVELWAKSPTEAAFELAGVDTTPNASRSFEFAPADGDGIYEFYTVSYDRAGNAQVDPADDTDVTLLDTLVPTVTSLARADTNPTNAATVDYSLEFSEDVTGVDVTDFAIDPATAGSSVTGVGGTGSSYTVTVATGTGSGDLGLNLVDDDSIVDVAGNPLSGEGTGPFPLPGDGSLSGEVYSVDHTVPTVSSISRADGAPATTDAASVHFIVMFSEDVTGVDSTDFSLASSTTNAPSISPTVAGSGDTYTVTVNTGSGDGVIDLDLIDDGSISDHVGNQLGGSGANNGSFTTGQNYTIDKAPITSITGGPAEGSTVTTNIVTFTYHSTDSDSTFQCRLDPTAAEISSDGGWTACNANNANTASTTGSTSYSGLSNGSHTFQVRATDPTGNRSAIHAARTWTVSTGTSGGGTGGGTSGGGGGTGGGGGGGGGGTPSPSPTPSPTPSLSVSPTPGTAPTGNASTDTDAFSPNGDGRLDTVGFTGSFSESIAWTLTVTRDGSTAAPAFTTSGTGDSMTATWDGRTADGPAPQGVYRWTLTGADVDGNELSPLTGTVVLDVSRPNIQSLRTSRSIVTKKASARISFSVNEEAAVVVKIKKNGRVIKRLGTAQLSADETGSFVWNGRNRAGRFVKAGRYRVVVVATDAAQNRTFNRRLALNVR